MNESILNAAQDYLKVHERKIDQNGFIELRAGDTVQALANDKVKEQFQGLKGVYVSTSNIGCRVILSCGVVVFDRDGLLFVSAPRLDPTRIIEELLEELRS